MCNVKRCFTCRLLYTLFDASVFTINDVYSLSVQEIDKLAGSKSKSAVNLYNNIRESEALLKSSSYTRMKGCGEGYYTKALL